MCIKPWLEKKLAPENRDPLHSVEKNRQIKKILLNFNNIDLLNITVLKEHYSTKITSKFVSTVLIE